jgi:hypothetical protein
LYLGNCTQPQPQCRADLTQFPDNGPATAERNEPALPVRSDFRQATAAGLGRAVELLDTLIDPQRLQGLRR